MSGDKQIEDMEKDKQTKIQQFAIDIQNVSAKVNNIIMEETHEFVSQNHRYNSLKDFHEAHPKSRCQMEAEFLTELGYRKIYDDHERQCTCYALGCQMAEGLKREVAREIFEEIEEYILLEWNEEAYAELKKKYIGKDTNAATKESEKDNAE